MSFGLKPEHTADYTLEHNLYISEIFASWVRELTARFKHNIEPRPARQRLVE